MTEAVEVRLLNSQIVEGALQRIPRELVTESREEMRGLRGIGADIKKAIAKTFEATNVGGQQRGEKYLYSSRGGQEEQQLWHDVDGNSIDSLRVRVLGSRKAELHEFGGEIRGEDGLLAVPVADAIGSSGMVKPEFRGGPQRLGLRKSGDVWEVDKRRAGDDIEIVPTASGTFITRIRSGGDRDDREWLFALEEQVQISGERLGFRTIVGSIQEPVTKRLEKAAGRALRKVERA